MAKTEKPSKEEIVDIRVQLKGKTRERFLKIKEKTGLENDTEVLRLIIMGYPLPARD
jgi:hypothetical protein